MWLTPVAEIAARRAGFRRAPARPTRSPVRTSPPSARMWAPARGGSATRRRRPQRVLDRHHGIGAVRERRPGGDAGGGARRQRLRPVAGTQPERDREAARGEVGGPHGVAVHGGGGKRRQADGGLDVGGEHAPDEIGGNGEPLDRERRGVLEDQPQRLAGAEQRRALDRCRSDVSGHARMLPARPARLAARPNGWILEACTPTRDGSRTCAAGDGSGHGRPSGSCSRSASTSSSCFRLRGCSP